MKLAVIQHSDIIEGSRFREDYGDIDELAFSLKKEGIIQPLAVREEPDGKYTLMAGGRRYKAAERAGITDIPVRIYPPDIDDLTMRSIELIENMVRKDLTWWEAAKLKEEIHLIHLRIHGAKVSTSADAKGWSQAMTADLLGISQAALTEDLKLAEAIDLVPGMKDLKNKAEARKTVKNLEEGLIRAELAKRISEKTAITGLDKVHQEMMSRYIVGDFFEVVKKVPDRSIDIVEIDPPYGIDLNAQKQGLQGAVYDKTHYNEVDQTDYVNFLNQTLKESYRVMSDNSWLIFWFGIEPWFETVHKAIVDAGFKTDRMVGIWVKQGGQSNNPSVKLANAYEPFFYARKGNPIISKQGRSNVFQYKGVHPDSKVHPTERPIELLQDILATFGWQSARCLVPFMGSGNTALAAANLGMQTIGCDLTQAYKDAFVIKVQTSRPGDYRSYKETTNAEG